MRRPLAFWLDVTVKASLIALLAFGAFSGLDRFAGKAFGWRLVGYSAAAAIVPVIWVARGRSGRYPYAIDTLFVLPFLIDTIGNALNLYDTVDWWDDANHFVNWAILTGAIAVLLSRAVRRRWELFGLVTGFGAMTAILWEVGEYFAFIRHSSELDTAYTDTLGDLSLGLGGSTLTATIAVAIATRSARRAGSFDDAVAARGSSGDASSRARS